eukprot:gnl/MRDRNA2_/MRDRNA2_76469_c0_seq1.p1 gnl/MRDRNA2_/MRDRNA2_76469_c0~~gnl/MRDRNA2_/MRDRNA2_76469_c0_seq1.p1  ORF type:complete len:769 (+),score=166.26 gnl/MRDRNA2_/MRDRNA2_76469_c0_seq1:158-2464(+)
MAEITGAKFVKHGFDGGTAGSIQPLDHVKSAVKTNWDISPSPGSETSDISSPSSIVDSEEEWAQSVLRLSDRRRKQRKKSTSHLSPDRSVHVRSPNGGLPGMPIANRKPWIPVEPWLHDSDSLHDKPKMSLSSVASTCTPGPHSACFSPAAQSDAMDEDDDSKRAITFQLHGCKYKSETAVVPEEKGANAPAEQASMVKAASGVCAIDGGVQEHALPAAVRESVQLEAVVPALASPAPSQASRGLEGPLGSTAMVSERMKLFREALASVSGTVDALGSSVNHPKEQFTGGSACPSASASALSEDRLKSQSLSLDPPSNVRQRGGKVQSLPPALCTPDSVQQPAMILLPRAAPALAKGHATTLQFEQAMAVATAPAPVLIQDSDAKDIDAETIRFSETDATVTGCISFSSSAHASVSPPYSVSMSPEPGLCSSAAEKERMKLFRKALTFNCDSPAPLTTLAYDTVSEPTTTEVPQMRFCKSSIKTRHVAAAETTIDSLPTALVPMDAKLAMAGKNANQSEANTDALVKSASKTEQVHNLLMKPNLDFFATTAHEPMDVELPESAQQQPESVPMPTTIARPQNMSCVKIEAKAAKPKENQNGNDTLTASAANAVMKSGEQVSSLSSTSLANAADTKHAVAADQLVLEDLEALPPPCDQLAGTKRRRTSLVQVQVADTLSDDTAVNSAGGRPQRRRIRPLQWWMNERVVYERKPGSLAPTVAGVCVAVLDDVPTPHSAASSSRQSFGSITVRKRAKSEGSAFQKPKTRKSR